MDCKKCGNPMKEYGRRPAYDVSSGSTGSIAVTTASLVDPKSIFELDDISERKLKTFICSNHECDYKEQKWV